ncbi:MAG: DUF167 domain-containing protein [Candidatus Hydrogenedentes bacterium]|nr:DUF167 domain-containing protein [Candidatus Hydrogenedentota bacterium]
MSNQEATLEVRVQTRASKDGLRLEPDGRVRVAVSAPPVDGRANEMVLSLLAKVLGLSKSKVALVRGEKSRFKVVSFRGISKEELQKQLQHVLRREREETDG